MLPKRLDAGRVIAYALSKRTRSLVGFARLGRLMCGRSLTLPACALYSGGYAPNGAQPRGIWEAYRRGNSHRRTSDGEAREISLGKKLPIVNEESALSSAALNYGLSLKSGGTNSKDFAVPSILA